MKRIARWCRGLKIVTRYVCGLQPKTVYLSSYDDSEEDCRRITIEGATSLEGPWVDLVPMCLGGEPYWLEARRKARSKFGLIGDVHFVNIGHGKAWASWRG